MVRSKSKTVMKMIRMVRTALTKKRRKTETWTRRKTL